MHIQKPEHAFKTYRNILLVCTPRQTGGHRSPTKVCGKERRKLRNSGRWTKMTQREKRRWKKENGRWKKENARGQKMRRSSKVTFPARPSPLSAGPRPGTPLLQCIGLHNVAR